jgi:glucose/arabinose dehydrogenase
MLVVLALVAACAANDTTPASPAANATPVPATPPTDVAPAPATPEEVEPTPVPQGEETPTAAAENDEPTAEAEVEPPSPSIEVVASGLQVPWALAFAPDGRLFITERPGTIRVVVGGQLQADPVAELSVAAIGEGGLMGLALDPDYGQNGYMYVMYTFERGGNVLNRISRFVLENDRAGDEQVLVDDIPGGRIHNGGILSFGPDGRLYAGTGDAGTMALAQDVDSLAGKILRLNPDGSVPEDNPWPGSYVYSIGHRNPQGLAWQPETGALFSTEHGPSGEMGYCCHDEVNLVEAGENYGWPEIVGDGGEPRYRDPVLHSGSDTWAPGAAAFYDGGPLTQWQGDLFFTGLRGASLYRLVLGGPDSADAAELERLYQNEFGRLRAVVMGPDGYLYFTTSNRDGRGQVRSGDDHIFRIVPQE